MSTLVGRCYLPSVGRCVTRRVFMCSFTFYKAFCPPPFCNLRQTPPVSQPKHVSKGNLVRIDSTMESFSLVGVTCPVTGAIIAIVAFIAIIAIIAITCFCFFRVEDTRYVLCVTPGLTDTRYYNNTRVPRFEQTNAPGVSKPTGTRRERSYHTRSIL